MCGYSATAMRERHIAPQRAMTMATTQASFGLSMNIWETLFTWPASLDRSDRHAARHAVRTVRDDPLADGKTLLHKKPVAV